MSGGKLYDLESETAVIGSVILQPEAIEKVWGYIEPGDFFDQRNRKIFRVAMDLHTAGQSIDNITIRARLTEENGDEDWALHLSGMLSGIPNNLHIETYADTVVELADKRLVMTCSRNLETAIAENNGIEEAKANLRLAIDKPRRRAADPWDKATFTLADAYRERPAVEYIIENLIPIPSLTIVYGAPGCLKSALLADLAVCVAAGLPWLPADAFDLNGRITKQAAVQWIDFDNGDITHNRFEAFAKARQVPADVSLFYTLMPHPWLDASSAEQMAALDWRLQKRGIKLLVIDNLITISGDLDENKPEIAGVMSHFRRLTDNLRIATILLHHPPKADDEILRGHGSITAALDLSLHIRRAGLGDTINVSPKKVRRAVPDAFSARFEYTHKPGTLELEAARFWGSNAGPVVKLTPSRLEVLKFFVENGASTIAEAKAGVRTVNPDSLARAAWELVEKGFLRRIDYGGKGKEAVLEPVQKAFAHLSRQEEPKVETCANQSCTGLEAESALQSES